MKKTIHTHEVIAACKAHNRAAFIGYLPANFPSKEVMIEAGKTLIDNGIDIIELGAPYSDPVMDGPVIQSATSHALDNGYAVSDLFDIIDELTTYSAKTERFISVVVMSYWNVIMQYGVDKFSQELVKVGGAGLITPDLIIEEASEWIEVSQIYNLDRIFLVAPSTSDERIKEIAENCQGFVYVASVMGITGVRQNMSIEAERMVDAVHRLSDQYACVGLGISNGQQAAHIGSFADGVIIGSALVKAVDSDSNNVTTSTKLTTLQDLAREVSAAMTGSKN